MFTGVELKLLALLLFMAVDVQSFLLSKFSSRYSKNYPIACQVTSAAFADYTGCALLFDCDGVVVETEELHRRAYNAAFAQHGLQIEGNDVEWSVEYYQRLMNTVGGGKPKMHHYFNVEKKKWPSTKGSVAPPPQTEQAQVTLVDRLQDTKVSHYKGIIGDAVCRPGVLRLMDAALDNPSLRVGICSAATRAGFEPLVHALLGEERLSRVDILLVGDDVPRKKPDSLIYDTAVEQLGLDRRRCLVIEDSIVGAKAATAAGCPCVISYTESTKDEDFFAVGAVAKLPNLAKVTLNDLFAALVEEIPRPADVLLGLRDP